MGVGLVFNVHSSSNRDHVLVIGCELVWFSMCTLMVTETVAWAFIVVSFVNICFGASFSTCKRLYLWSLITLVTHHVSVLFFRL